MAWPPASLAVNQPVSMHQRSSLVCWHADSSSAGSARAHGPSMVSALAASTTATGVLLILATSIRIILYNFRVAIVHIPFHGLSAAKESIGVDPDNIMAMQI